MRVGLFSDALRASHEKFVRVRNGPATIDDVTGTRAASVVPEVDPGLSSAYVRPKEHAAMKPNDEEQIRSCFSSRRSAPIGRLLVTALHDEPTALISPSERGALR
jgi:hypothetical protein